MEIDLSHIATVAYSTRETLYMTHRLALEAVAVDGCFVECGVGAGAQLMAMCMARTGRDIIGFDSFEGIPMAGPEDETQPGIGPVPKGQKSAMISSGITSHSMENVLENFVQFSVGCPNLRLVKGWFCDTMPRFKPRPIALLRLDGDLYESTKTCMHYLYPMVSVGGIVIIDDYALEGCKKAVHEYFAEIGMPELHGDGVVYFYKKDNYV